MRLASPWFLVVGLLGGGCDNGKQHLHPPPADARPDAAQARWWQPAPGETRDWDIQIAAPFDVSAQRAMYVLDLWTLVPAETTLDHGDGDPVVVPAGALAGTIAELHGRATPAIVVCRVRTGALRLSEPDARKFPGYEATPPDRPDPPSAGSVIGWSTGDAQAPDERFLDIRAGSLALWSALIWKRLELAQQIGCDAVEADRNDMVTSDPGFAVDVLEQRGWYEQVAAQAHARELSVGMKNGNTLPGLTDALADDFDWMLVERCGEFQDCDTTRPFLNAQRAVFALDYQTDVDGAPLDPVAVCGHQQLAAIDEGLVKDVGLSSAYRYPCVP